jgi:RNA recognition motif-containing protein
MATKLYVGNLSYKTTDEELSAFFAPFGTVTSAQVVTDRYSGQSRGFGFVEIEGDEDAQKAISALDGQSLDGRALMVNVSRPREGGNRSGGGGSDRSGGGERSGGYGKGRW